ncbi:MAG: hypothetical protein VZR95_08425 [Alphaproteobacteria bacterium]
MLLARDEIKAIVLNTIRNTTDVDDISDEDMLQEDLELDSLEMFNICIDIESEIQERYGACIDLEYDGSLSAIATVGEFIDCIAEKLSEA